MKTKTLFWLIAVLSLLSVSCDKNSPAGHNSGNNGEKPDEPLVELPELDETDDVCTKMDDLNFMAYCYDNFDVNNDGKVSMTEANAVTTIECNNATSFAGLEYFTNLKNFASSSVQKADFRYNKNLETIDCSDSDIESVDLRYSDKLTSITFSSCRFLTDIVLPNNLTSIGESAFSSCSSLASINLPNNLTSIGSQAFYCSSLVSINFPDNLTSIGWRAFFFSSLISINLPENLRSIGSQAFYGSSSLTSVDASLCRSLESIYSNAFNQCPIEEFLLGTSDPPSLDYVVFNHMPDDAVLKVPAQSVETYKNSKWAYYFGTIEAL